MSQTHWDGVDEGSNSKWQAAAQHGEDGVAHVVVNRVSQRALSHVHGGLGSDGDLLRWVLLSIYCTSILRRASIALLKVKYNSNPFLRNWYEVKPSGWRRFDRVVKNRKGKGFRWNETAICGAGDEMLARIRCGNTVPTGDLWCSTGKN